MSSFNPSGHVQPPEGSASLTDGTPSSHLGELPQATSHAKSSTRDIPACRRTLECSRKLCRAPPEQPVHGFVPVDGWFGGNSKAPTVGVTERQLCLQTGLGESPVGVGASPRAPPHQSWPPSPPQPLSRSLLELLNASNPELKHLHNFS